MAETKNFKERLAVCFMLLNDYHVLNRLADDELTRSQSIEKTEIMATFGETSI